MALKVLRQVDSTDCGPACLATVLAYWGRLEPLYRLRDLAGTTQAGTSFAGLYRAASKLNVEIKAFGADLEGLKTLELPLILHWEHNHYVVLFRLTPKRALLGDPATGRRWVTLDELGDKWTGKLLWLKPAHVFERGDFGGRRGFGGLLAHLSHFRGAGPVLFEVALSTVILALLSLSAPILSQILFDQVLTYREASLLPYLLAGIFLLSAFQTAFGTAQGYMSGHLAMKLNYRLELGYLDHLLRLPQRVHETRLVGDLLSRFGDLRRVRDVLTKLMAGLPAAVLTLALSMGILFVYNVPLALVALVNLPLQILYLGWLSPRLRRISREELKKDGEVQSFLIGNLEGVSTLKALSAEPWAMMRGRNQVSSFMDVSWRSFLLSMWGGMVFGLLGHLGSLVTLLFGATQVLKLELTVGQLIAAYGLMQNAVGALSTITGHVEEIQEGVVASDRLQEVLELEPESALYSRPLKPLERSLRVENLSFSYPSGQSILQDVSFTLPQGSYTTLLGANGSGKSTLAALLARMQEPSTGRIFWDDTPFYKAEVRSVRERVVYLRQEVPVFYATLRDNLTLGRDLPEESLWHFIEALDLEGVVQRLPEGLDTTIGGDSLFRLSSGEKQMLGLVRALLSPADVLILDEPTATLDSERETRVLSLLQELKGQRTFLVITHRPALIAPSDQVLDIQGGSVRQSERVA